MNTLTPTQLKVLLSGLNPARVATRKQSGINLSYLEAWDVKATLIRVFGFGGFDAEVTQSAIVDMREVPSKNNKTNWKISAQATVRLHVHQLDCTYTETAIGGSTQPDLTEALDMAIKTAESDALKRAAVYLGTQFGLSLYNQGSTAEVVRRVVAPGQEWQNGAPVNVEDQSQDTEAAQEVTGTSQVTPEQRAENEALVQRAINAKRMKDAEYDESSSDVTQHEIDAENYGGTR